MATLLIPTDFSSSARNAMKYAMNLYGDGHQYILFNAYDEPTSNVSSMVSLRDILYESSVDSLNEEKQELLNHYPDLDVELVSEYGDPAATLLRYIKTNEVDAIVMGTDGHAGLKKLVLGTVAGEVLAKANVPVIIVPKSYQDHQRPHKILYTADLKENAETRLSGMLTSIIEENKSEITILTITPPGKVIDRDKAETGYNLHLSMNGYSHQFDVLESSNVSSSILTYLGEGDYQLLVTTPHESSWFERLRHPSVSKDLAERLKVPMMALH